MFTNNKKNIFQLRKIDNLFKSNLKVKELGGYTPKNFDWKYYLQNNTDLLKYGINTKVKALKHWALYGHKEKDYIGNMMHLITIMMIFL